MNNSHSFQYAESIPWLISKTELARYSHSSRAAIKAPLLLLIGMCPANPALQGGVKGHNMKNHLAGEPRLLGRGASQDDWFGVILKRRR